MAQLETEVAVLFANFMHEGDIPCDKTQRYSLARYAKDIICNEVAVEGRESKLDAAIDLLDSLGQEAASVVLWGLQTQGHEICYSLLERYISSADTLKLDMQKLVIPVAAATLDGNIEKRKDAGRLLMQIQEMHFSETVKHVPYNSKKSAFYDIIFSMLNHPVQKEYAIEIIENGLKINPHDKIIIFSLVRSLDNEVASDYCTRKLEDIGPIKSAVLGLLRAYHTQDPVMSERSKEVLLHYSDSPVVLRELFKSLSNREYKEKDLEMLKRYRKTRNFAESFEDAVSYLPAYMAPDKELISNLEGLFRGMRPNRHIVSSFFRILENTGFYSNYLPSKDSFYKCNGFIIKKLEGWKKTSIRYSASAYTAKK